MAEIIITGPAGRIEGRLNTHKDPFAPVALILHPHPLYGGSMNNKVTYTLYKNFYERGFNACRFNFRGIGKSSGSFDNGEGELMDAASVLDWLQAKFPHASSYWISGFSFGAWIAMQLLMRRPELQSFVCVAPPANQYDFNFLAPCPVSGQIIQGTDDKVVTTVSVQGVVEKINRQKNISVELAMVEGASHFFLEHLEALGDLVRNYIEKSI